MQFDYEKSLICVFVSQEFFFEHWLDDSEEFAGGKLLATRLTLDLRVEPGDEETREEMERMKTELHNRNRCVGGWGWDGETK